MTDYIYFNIFFGYGQDRDNPVWPNCRCVDGSGVGPDCCSGGFVTFVKAHGV